MYDSNSFIKQSLAQSKPHESSAEEQKYSMLKSQTHPVKPSSKHISLPTKQNILRSTAQQALERQRKLTPTREVPPSPPKQTQHQAEQIFFNKTAEQQPFLKYYEDNIQLQKKQEAMSKQIFMLREKIKEKDDYTRSILEQQIVGLAKGKKSHWDTKHPKQQNIRGKSGSHRNIQTNKVEHLLQIIDHYKSKLLTAEEEITNLKRQKHLLEQDVKLKDKRYTSMQADHSSANNNTEELNLSDKLKRSIRELELEKQRSKSFELALKGLQAKIKANQSKFNQIQELKSQKRILEEQIMRMTQLPSFNNVIDKADEQKNIKQIQNKLKLTSQKYNKLEDKFIKTDADLKIMMNKMIQAQYNINTLQNQNKELRKQSINNHILLRLNNDPDMLQQVFLQIEKKKKVPVKQPENSKIKIEKLILEKQELAKQNINYQTRIRNLENEFRERQKLIKLQKEQTVATVSQPKTSSSKQGVIYQGDTSVFSQQNINIPYGSNYFDLYLGQVTVLESVIQTVTGLSNPSNPLILATVDFYNHNTESSKLTQGCRCNLQSQFFFKVNQDDFFFKYLQKGSLKIQVWASQGSKHYNLGKATIELKNLIARAKPRVSPVYQSSATLYLNSRVLGSINFALRMRMPIFDQVQKLKEGTTSAFQGKEQAAIRRLVIQIEEGKGFGQKSNTFVYFPFRMEDHYTRASKGNNPSWNYIKMLEIAYDTDFKSYLRKGDLQFIVFDDNAAALDDRNLDVGSCFVNLAPLLEGNPIRERLEIKKGNQRRGTIDVKIFWYEVEEGGKDYLNLGIQSKFDQKSVHGQLRSFMKEWNIDAQKLFRLIDDNRTGLISFEQFQSWIRQNASNASKYPSDIISKYYKGFKEPVNHHNFVSRISQQYNQMQASRKETEGVAVGITMINQLLKANSTQMKKTSLEEYLDGKNLLQVMQQIQTDKSGHITKQKLQQYLDKHGLQASIVGEKVKLIDFLRKHQKLRLTL